MASQNPQPVAPVAEESSKKKEFDALNVVEVGGSEGDDEHVRLEHSCRIPYPK